MSQSNPIKLFVCHAWQEEDDYLRVFEYLESDSNFYYQNYSAPERMPSSGEKEAVREELRKQIGQVEVVIALAGMARKHNDLLLFQLNFAKACDKPVVLLENYGVKEPVAKILRDLADEAIEWDKRSLIDAIRRQARHEETTRWDTIEFKLD